MHLARAVDEHVHFAADSKVGKINAWLDRKARARQDAAVVARLEIVDVRAVAVGFLADAMPGAMQEIRAIPSRFNHLPRRVVHLPAAKVFVRANRAFHPIDRGVPGLSDNAEDMPMVIGGGLP